MMLTPQCRELLRGPNFAVIATINADGTPQQSVVWVTEDDGNVVFSTVEGRAKHRNLVRDPRIGVLVLDYTDGYRYSQIRGIARLESTNTDTLIDELSRKYTGKAWVEKQTRPRVNVIVTPTHQHDYSE
jgi:PPOX class probable F420-dependent enzyme